MKRKGLLIIMLMLLGINTMSTAQTNLSGDQAKAGTFYLMNVNSGKYLKFGGANNEKAAEGNAGTAVTLAKKGDAYTIKTNAGYLDSNLKMTGTASEWILTKVDGTNQYYLKASNGNGVLTSKNDINNGLLGLASYNPDDNKQKWILFTSSTIKSMTKNAVSTFNATPLLQAAAFDKNDNIGAWSGLTASNIVAINESSDAAEYGAVLSGSSVTITQTLSGMSQGTYKISFDALYNATGNATAQVTIAAKKNTVATIPIAKDETLTSNNQAEVLSRFKTNSTCKHSEVFTFNGNNTSITISITLQGQNTIACIDNFALYFVHDKGQEEDDVNNLLQQQLIASLNSHIDEVRAKVNALNEVGQAAYNIDDVIADRDAGRINTQELLEVAIAAIDAAYEVALAAHNQKEMDDLLNGGNNGDGNEGDGDDEEDKEIDVTDLFIKNAGFGTGDDRYWTHNGAVISTSGVPVTGATGSYLFRGSTIKQDVHPLPSGRYKLTAKVASTNGTTVTLTANEGKLTEQSTSLETTTEMSEIILDKVIVYDGTLYIRATGDAEFYTDDFSLSYQEALPGDPQLKDTETLDAAEDFYPTITVTRTLKANTWSTFVVPFNMAIPEGWEVKTLASSTVVDESITLYFEDAESIEAGVPYMVRTTEATSTITGTNTWLSTELRPTSTDHVEFIGVYASCHVPTGSYFISSNKFYRCVNEENPDKVKGYRGYITPTAQAANARNLGYRFDSREEEGTTAIDNEELNNEATVVAIYTLSGIRINEMQQGTNILQMSNGTTIKVVIK